MILDSKPVLLFDGTCVLCNWFFQWVIKKDKLNTFTFATIQSNFGQQLIIDQHLPTEVDSVLLYDQSKVYIFSAAALKVLILLGGYHKWLGHIGLWCPRMIRDGVYKFISRYRYKWFGVKACMIPDKILSGRFKS
jgi:predicted DCC family thiol-disulfide oxidoreductase YuxK